MKLVLILGKIEEKGQIYENNSSHFIILSKLSKLLSSQTRLILKFFHSIWTQAFVQVFQLGMSTIWYRLLSFIDLGFRRIYFFSLYFFSRIFCSWSLYSEKTVSTIRSERDGPNDFSRSRLIRNFFLSFINFTINLYFKTLYRYQKKLSN